MLFCLETTASIVKDFQLKGTSPWFGIVARCHGEGKNNDIASSTPANSLPSENPILASFLKWSWGWVSGGNWSEKCWLTIGKSVWMCVMAPSPYPVIGVLFLTCISLYSGMPNLSKTHARAIFITHTHHACRPESVKESIPQGAVLGQGRLGGADETCSLLILTWIPGMEPLCPWWSSAS